MLTWFDVQCRVFSMDNLPRICQDLMLRAAGELPENGAGATGHIFEATEEEMAARHWTAQRTAQRTDQDEEKVCVVVVWTNMN